MKRTRLVGAIAALVALVASMTAGANGTGHTLARAVVGRAGTYAAFSPTELVIGNGLIERRWQRSPFETTTFTDKRNGTSWASTAPDFHVTIGPATVTSADFTVLTASSQRLPNGGLDVTLELSHSATAGTLDAVAGITRTIEIFPGVAGIRTQTILHLSAAVPLARYTLDQVSVGAAQPSSESLRAGSDWRQPGWNGPTVSVGDGHAGDFRVTTTAPQARPLSGAGEWLTLSRGNRSMFMVMERNDQPSSRITYDGTTASLLVDPGQDVVGLGPEEASAHAENPAGTGRPRVVGPGDVILEPAFTGLSDHAGDDAWQFHLYLGRNGAQPSGHHVAFNSNGIDSNARSTGAKDDVDFAVVQAVAPKLRALGVDTFVLDDGWQAVSGDWCPDSPQCPDPRWDGTPKTSAFRPRYPDATFAAVRKAIAPMRLGLWMSPMEFNPSSARFKAHPEQSCAPVGTGLALANLTQDTGSYEAGVGAWGPDAIPYIESRITLAIEKWGVSYFKFDFMTWLDCLGQGDLYQYRDAFVAMLDRLIAANPGVQFQLDETNDYRLFPYESTTRGSTWFLNGNPSVSQSLHALWDLSPWVPAQALGFGMLTVDPSVQPVSTQLAAALLSSPTYFSDPRNLPSSVVKQARPWLDLYNRQSSAFSGVVYPLLADPLRNRWTGLQAWNADTESGAVIAFRQQSTLRNVRLPLTNVADGRYEIREALTDKLLAVRTGAQLRSGLAVTIAAPNGSAVLLVSRIADYGGTSRQRSHP